MTTYRDSGVDIDAGQSAVNMIQKVIQKSYGSNVLSGADSFGGMIDVSYLKNMKRPVLVASTDGVGTKTKIAVAMKKFDTIGQDLVNHCINDILVQGASPLFFLDYVATSKLNPQIISEVISGVAIACRKQRTALLGGETAEMPGVYLPGEIDLAGTIVGVVESDNIIDGSRICEGDIVLALPSTGLHTNGYSLARHIFQARDYNEYVLELNGTIGDSLLRIHKCYHEDITLLRSAHIDIKGLVHITGGGLIENPPRILPKNLSMQINKGSWKTPSIFKYLQKEGKVSDEEMFRTFNMGLGMLVIVSKDQALKIESFFGNLFMLKVGEVILRNSNNKVRIIHG